MNLEDIKKPIELYTSDQIAKYIGCSAVTLHRLVKSGKIKAVNIGKPESKRPIYRFRAEDIQDYYDHLPNTSSRIEDVNK